MANAYLGGTDLGLVTNFQLHKRAQLDKMSMTGMNSDYTIADDMEGAIMDVSFTTMWNLSGTNKFNKINDMLSFITGLQLTPSNFYIPNIWGSVASPKKVKVDDIRIMGREGEQTVLTINWIVVECVI